MQKLVPVRLCDEESVDSIVMFADRQTIASARVLRDSGEMIAPVTIARTGDMLYKAKELGAQFADLPPDQVVRVSTPPEVLFDEATIEMCRSMAVTIGHPKEDVSLSNNKELQKGFLEGIPLADGSHLSGYIVLNDQTAINLVDSGVDQTSWGHDAVLKRVDTNGVVSAVKTKITSVNHLAIVQRGRAQTTRIGDSGEEISIVDQKLYDTLEAEKDALLVKVETLETKLADAVASKLSDEAVNAEIELRVKARTELLIDVAKLGDEYSAIDGVGKSESEIRREVAGIFTGKDVSGKSEEYVQALFDSAMDSAGEVTLSDALSASMLSDSDRAAQPKKPSVAEEAKARRAQRYKD